MKRFRDIIPEEYRRRGLWVILAIFLRAMLNFLGLAVMLPVLMIILDSETLHSSSAMQWLYSTLGFTSDREFVIAVAFGVVAIIALKSLLSLALYSVERNYIYSLYRRLSLNLYATYYRRGLSFVKSVNSAVLGRNINVVCLSFVVGVLRPMATILCEVMLFVMLFISLAVCSIKSAVIVLALFIPAILIYYGLVRGRLIRYGEAENRAHREKSKAVMETFRGFADVEINNAFPMMLRRVERAMDEVIEAQKRNTTLGMLPSLLTETGLALGMALLIVATLYNFDAEITLIFGVFAVAAIRLMPSVRGIMNGWAAIKYNRYSIDTILNAEFDSIDNQEIDCSDKKFDFKHEIVFNSVGFHFDDDPENDVLDGITLTIKKGEHIGIRGESGAGKTTLFNLLLGLYEPTSGEILIDGVKLDKTTRRSWQNSVGYVSQSVFLTDGTFAENVALGEESESIDRKRVAEALSRARLGDFIDSLKSGADTRIGECGCRLSGGQRQRIGIARALYKGADILFFDEATSSLDDKTEQEINLSIEELSKSNSELTIVVIAHRESSLSYCRRVIDLQK